MKNIYQQVEKTQSKEGNIEIPTVEVENYQQWFVGNLHSQS